MSDLEQLKKQQQQQIQTQQQQYQAPTQINVQAQQQETIQKESLDTQAVMKNIQDNKYLQDERDASGAEPDPNTELIMKKQSTIGLGKSGARGA